MSELLSMIICYPMDSLWPPCGHPVEPPLDLLGYMRGRRPGSIGVVVCFILFSNRFGLFW